MKTICVVAAAIASTAGLAITAWGLTFKNDVGTAVGLIVLLLTIALLVIKRDY